MVVVFEQLAERDKKRKEERGSMLDRSETGDDHWLQISLSSRFLSIWKPLCGCPEGKGRTCVSNSPQVSMACKYHNFQSKECEATTHIKKFSKATEHPSTIVCAALYMSPQPSPKFTVTSIKWQLKGTVVNSACVFQTLKCFCAEGHHLVHAETAVWHLSAAPEKATLQLASGDSAWLLREWKVFLQVPLSDVPVLKECMASSWTQLHELLSQTIKLTAFLSLFHPAHFSWVPLCLIAAKSRRSGGHVVTAVIQLPGMNCDGLRGVVWLGGRPTHMMLVNCQQT